MIRSIKKYSTVLAFILPGLVFTFQRTAYEKRIICTGKDKIIEINGILCESGAEIMQRVLKVE